VSAHFRAVIFDFDLTLADSRRGFIACHRHAAAAFGLGPPSDREVEASIGTPLDLVFPSFYGPEHAALAEGYIRVYQQHADEVMTALTVMLPGASEAVRQLRSSGYQLAIVSQKLRYRVEDVLRRESLLGCFGAVLGGDDIPAFKPDPGGLRMALDRLAVERNAAVFVGDTVIDAETAQRVDMPFIAVLSGNTGAGAFAPFGPLTCLASVAALPAFLGLTATNLEARPDR
jgi:phosphoglycolate phosphatase